MIVSAGVLETMRSLGLTSPASWLSTIALALLGLAFMLAFSPLADKLATRLVHKPPTLGAFRGLQKSRAKLIAGIVLAWILGGFLEELILRGIILQWVEARLSIWLAQPLAVALAICAAALVAWVIHLYQGLRAALIIAQISVLFGLLFVISGHNLWSVILCHGLYDTIAFVRFANKQSRYSQGDV